MTKDFSKYQNIVDQFRGEVSTSDFEARFATKTAKIPKSERFLLKMELKRLAGDCTRLIDLRGQVDGECKAFEHEGRTHFLDDLAIQVFEENIEHYGKYTFGVYEAVKNTENNFRVMYEKEKLNLASDNPELFPPEAKIYEKTQYPAKLATFAHYADRAEERMNYAIAVEIFADEDTHFDATSSDISVSGCRIRVVTGHEFSVGQIIDVRFSGLEDEFEFGAATCFSYQVRNIHKSSSAVLIGCQRVSGEETDSRDSFTKFLSGFIQGNKRRYKINLDNSITALESRTLEHFILPKINELPVFLQQTKQGLFPRYALTCDNNKAIYHYWQNENQQSTLDFLLTQDRIERLQQSEHTQLLVYCFIHKSQGKHYFYSADEIQLAGDKDFKHQFLGFCANKPTFGVFKLSITPVKQELMLSPYTLSDSLQKKDQYLNAAPPKETQKIISKLTQIVTVKGLTDEHLLPHYQHLEFEHIDVSKLKKFGHKRHKQVLEVNEAGINYKNQRQEARFKYVTPATVSAEDLTWQGASADFSMSGLKIRLEKSAILMKGDIVHLHFPELQRIAKGFDLSALPYEIVSVNRTKTVINCRVYIEQHQHIGRSFFKLLIEKNRDKLTPDEYTMMTPGLSKALRNIYSASITTPFIVVQTSGSRYKFDTIASSGEFGNLLPKLTSLSDNPERYNLYPFLSDLNVLNDISAQLKKLSESDKPVIYTLYISLKPGVKKVDKAVKMMQAKELNMPEQHAFFINNALNNGEFLAVRLKLSRVKSPDMEYLNPELSYIGNYAIHRAKQIEQDIWSIVGSIELVDITREVLALHKVST